MWISETTAALRRVPFALYDLTGAPLTGSSVTGSQLQLSKNGGTLTSFAGSTPTNVGGNLYYYEFTTGECDTEGWVALVIVKSGVGTVPPILVSIDKRPEDRMAAWVHDTGRTFIGLAGRLEAFLSGKATGLVGTTPSFFRADGTTVSFTTTQTTSTGARDAADVSNRP